MEEPLLACDAPAATAQVSRFEGPGGVCEYHFVVTPTRYAAFDVQLDWALDAYRDALASAGLDGRSAVLRRFFCSDPVNQAAALAARPFSNPRDPRNACAVSWAGQPPAPPAKVALWAWHIADPTGEIDLTRAGATTTLNRGETAHHWTTGLEHIAPPDSEAQTRRILESYDAILHGRGMRLADHVVRTWFFVQNIDANYHGLVVARREHFARRGLTPDTHYIASTGIEGAPARVEARVVMDAWAVSGLRPEQVEHLQALDHLSPTHVYGVTFERGTALTWRDRRHLILSGTASIDRNGAIVHPGDVSLQLGRTLENMEALLHQGGATLDDMRVFIVYVRDASDLELAQRQMVERFGDTPILSVVAPVCRPGWLIEIEGLALAPVHRPDLPAF